MLIPVRSEGMFIALVLHAPGMDQCEHVNQLTWKPRFTVRVKDGEFHVPQDLVREAWVQMGADFAVLMTSSGLLISGNPIGPGAIAMGS